MILAPIVSLLELTDAKLDRRISQFQVADDRTRALISAIGREFANGYNDCLRSFDPDAVRAHVDQQDDDYLAPFYVEGASMALAAINGLHAAPAGRAHRQLLDALPAHKYLIFAGWGWWYAVRPLGVGGLRRSAMWEMPSLFAGLGVDGMAFATCFLRAKPPSFDVTCPFNDPARRTLWTQGYGRALWFVAGGQPGIFQAQYQRLSPDLRPELFAGIGLATAFASLRHLSCVPPAATTVKAEQRAFYQGFAFGLTARHDASPTSYHHFLDRLDCTSRQWVTDAIDHCLAPPQDIEPNSAARYTEWQRQVRRDLAPIEQPV